MTSSGDLSDLPREVRSLSRLQPLTWENLADRSAASLPPDEALVWVGLNPPIDQPALDMDAITLGSWLAEQATVDDGAGVQDWAVTILRLEQNNAPVTIALFGQDDELLTVAEVAGILKCSTSAVYNALNDPTSGLISIRIGKGLIRIRKRLVQETLEAEELAVRAAREAASVPAAGQPGRGAPRVRVLPPTRKRPPR